MFASLIRRKSDVPQDGGSEIEFDSTTVSLSTAVPRPVERRTDERMSGMLRVAKLTSASGAQQLIRVKNLSAGGLMAIVPNMPEVGDQVHVELSSEKIPASVASSIRISTSGNSSPGVSRATVSVRVLRDLRSPARRRFEWASFITASTCTTFR